ncbi:uncharacterized protein LOC120688809 [Panicum virgatum]|uniref:MBD domain-containing protein n=1 Tax=Panicum virgatum TaxID=38727 RepID=A0A8T0MIB2_PANVG|nr:uncharacterized protein LOC120688809 [Panicum virgatum]KAG2536857.1 hypothetical protein PVAP13_9NG226800 [Panicum virgatum]
MDGKSTTIVPIKEEVEEVNEQIVSNEEEEEDIEALAEPPDWLPDGWIMEVYREEDGTIHRYYTSPISDYTFNMKSEVLEYLFSQADERILESKESGAENTFQKEHEWLPKGWVMEIRAGGEKMDKMYKFYVYQKTGVRVLSKQDVVLYINEEKVSKCDTNGQCDTNSKDNLLAIVEFHPSGLPKGWVKELVFRKTKDGLIRRDPYYTDSASSYTFRTLKSALLFVETGKISKRAFIQRISVHDLYSFDNPADLHESLRSRLTINDGRSSRPRGVSQIEYGQIMNSSEDGDDTSDSDLPYEPEEENSGSGKAKGKEATDSRTTNRPIRRPPQLRIKEEVTENQDAD